MYEMHRKSVSQVMFNYWIVEEMKERNIVGKTIFGPYYLDQSKQDLLTYKQSVETFLATVDKLRVDELYFHKICSGN